MKVAFLDIETTGLDANRGWILCACYRLTEIGKVAEPKRITRIDEGKRWAKDMTDDHHCVMDIWSWIEKDNPDFLVTFNGDLFDIPYVNSRLLLRGKYLRISRSIDHWKTGRYKLRMGSQSMNAMAKFLKLKVQKTFFEYEVWKRAMFGSKKDMDKVVLHCGKDIDVLEAIHRKVFPLLKTLPGLY